MTGFLFFMPNFEKIKYPPVYLKIILKNDPYKTRSNIHHIPINVIFIHN